jgi:ABC-2 type transport system permease protein
MIGTVARKEFLALRRDSRVRMSAAVLVVMLIVALLSAAARYADLSQERAAAQALINEQWDTQGEKNPHAAAHYGVYAIRPVTPLSLFDTGVTSFSGVSIWLEAHRRNLPGGRPADDNAAATGVADLTVAYTLQILLPLFVILLAFPAFAAEREQGTLRQLLGTGVTPGALLAGKALGIAGSVMLVIGPILLIGLAVLALLPGGSASLPQALALVVTYLVYALVVLFVALAVSARAPTAQASLVILLAFWAVTSFVVPRVAADLAGLRHDLPHAVDFDAAIAADIETGLDGRVPADVIEERRRQTLELYGANAEADLPINFQGIVFSLREQLDAAVFARHFDDLYNRLLAQQSVYGIASLVSPRIAVQLASMQWSGTGLAQYIEFGNHAEAFRMDFIEALNQDLTVNSAPGQTDYRSGPELWRTIGDYAFPAQRFIDAVRSAGPFVLVLALWLAASVTASWIGVRRIKVTI